MKIFSAWSLRSRLWIPTLVLILGLALGTLTLVHWTFERMLHESLPEQRTLLELSRRCFDLLSEIREYMIEPTPATRLEIAERGDQLHRLFEDLKLLARLEPAGAPVLYSQIHLQARRLTTLAERSLELRDRLSHLLADEKLWPETDSGAALGAAELLRRSLDAEVATGSAVVVESETLRSLRVVRTELRAVLEELEDAEQQLTIKLEKAERLVQVQLDREPQVALFGLVVLTLLIAVLASALAIWLAGHLSRPLRALQAASQRFAEGDLTARALVSADDEVGQVTHSFNDLADKIENLVGELRAAHDYSENILAAVPIALIALNDQRQIVQANAIAALLLTEVFAKPRPFGSAIDDVISSVELVRALAEAETQGVAGSFELACARPAGFENGAEDHHEIVFNTSVVSVRSQMTTAVTSAEGHPSRPVLLVVLQDVTERQVLLQQLQENLAHLKDTQAQLVQSGKMVAVGELASGVAHELNNPLTAVLTYAVLLNEQIEHLPMELQTQLTKFAQRLQRIRSAAEQCQSIVKDLLSFARQDPSETALVDLREVLECAFELISTQIRRQGQRYQMSLESPELYVRGNANQLQQVAINLALNAVQAMEPGGDLTVSARREGDVCELFFTDTGCGIPSECLNRIFDPFFTTKPAGKGTGLGLSIVYGILANHGGMITVDSVLGRGTTFRVCLPASNLEHIA